MTMTEERKKRGPKPGPAKERVWMRMEVSSYEFLRAKMIREHRHSITATIRALVEEARDRGKEGREKNDQDMR